jgi:chromosome segregation ATPase
MSDRCDVDLNSGFNPDLKKKSEKRKNNTLNSKNGKGDKIEELKRHIQKLEQKITSEKELTKNYINTIQEQKIKITEVEHQLNQQNLIKTDTTEEIETLKAIELEAQMQASSLRNRLEIVRQENEKLNKLVSDCTCKESEMLKCKCSTLVEDNNKLFLLVQTQKKEQDSATKEVCYCLLPKYYIYI